MNISKIIVDGKINWDYVKPMVSNYYEGSENLIRCFEHSYSINEKKEWLSQYKPSSNRKYNDGVNNISVKFFNILIETNDYKKTIAIVFKSNIKINSFRCNLSIIRRIAFLFCNENIIANDIFLLIWNIDKDKNVLEKVVNNVREMPFFSKDEVRTILLGYQKFFNWLEKNKNGMYREIAIKDMLRFSMSFFCGLRYDSSISKIRWKNIKDEYIECENGKQKNGMVNIIKCSREVIERKDNLLYELVLKIKDLYNSESLVFKYRYNMDFKRVVKEFLLYDSTYYNFFDLYIKWLSTPHIGRRSCVNMMHESGFSNEDIGRLVKMSVENVDNYIGEKNKIGREQGVVENWSKELNDMLEIGLVVYNEDSKIVMFLKEFVDMLYEKKVFKDKIKVLNIIYEFVDKMIKKHYKK